MFNFNTLYFSVKSYINEILIWWWKYLIDISLLLLLAITAYLLTCFLIYELLKQVNQQAWQLPGPPNRLMLVTAHPDDEVMFFGPIIYRSTKIKSMKIYLLCLSIGGDKKRKQELWKCAKKLGIPESNVIILSNSDMIDNPNIRWPNDKIADAVSYYIESYKINAVVTFDKHGVSQHQNHISIYYGMASLCMQRNKIPDYCRLYILETVHVFRKYTQLLDLPISLLFSSYWYLITYEQQKSIKNAMMAHKSQYVWFRKLYMIFSRYTFINTFNELKFMELEIDW